MIAQHKTFSGGRRSVVERNRRIAEFAKAREAMAVKPEIEEVVVEEAPEPPKRKRGRPRKNPVS